METKPDDYLLWMARHIKTVIDQMREPTESERYRKTMDRFLAPSAK